MKNVAIIMAGGKGERLWPRSRDSYPKQFLEIIPKKGSLLQQTVKRILPLVNINDIFIVTSIKYKPLVSKQLPKLPTKNIICEPEAKNTSPAIEYATMVVKERYGDAITIILPSDHVILDNEEFIKTLKHAIELAHKNNLVTLGIKPLSPDTGYGYIKVKPNSEDVECFKEKPDLIKAKEYLKNGHYYWNSGMFIWKVSTILDAFDKHMNAQHKAFTELFNSKNKRGLIAKTYHDLESISIDYAIMEKAKNVKAIKSIFRWDDVGSWLSLSRINKLDINNNFLEGNVLSIDTKNSIVSSHGKLIATLGVDNLIVIETKDSILIASKDKLKDIKKIRKSLKDKNQNLYL